MDVSALRIRRMQDISDQFLPICMQSLQIESILDFDLYVAVGREMVLFRASHLPFTAKARAALLENGVDRLYIPRDSRQAYQTYIRSNITRILADSSLDDFSKSSIVYDAAKELVKSVMADPTKGENIRSSQALVEATVMHVLGGQSAFHSMLRVMSYDYSTYTHSVNVCTFSLALALSSGIDATSDLVALGTGALLHDVGKTRVPDSILLKPGPLDPSEMEIVRHHPQWGVELVRQTDLIPEVSYVPIAQHHERQDHSGYPDRLGGDEIHVFGRVVAITDVFDAMTTERVYRSARDTYPTLKTMYAARESFDGKLMDHFAQLMGPSHRAGR